MLTGSPSVAMEEAAAWDGGRLEGLVVTTEPSLAGQSEDTDLKMLDGP